MTAAWRPTRRQVVIVGGLASAASAVGGIGLARRSERIEVHRAGLAFGTTVKLKARHHDVQQLNVALDQAWTELIQVEREASLFRPHSPLSVLNREGVLHDPSPILSELFEQSLAAARLTGGAFDITVQPLWQLYKKCATEGRSPTSEERDAVRSLIGTANIEVDRDRIRLLKPGMAVTLNGIAQGYATHRCLSVLASHGIADAFLDTGEIGIAGTREPDERWTAAIADPRAATGHVALAKPLSGILATSGDYSTSFSSDFTVHHIFDPATLQSPLELASASVLAKSGALADALATAMMVMGSNKSLALASSLQDVEVLLIGKDGRAMRTPGFPLA